MSRVKRGVQHIKKRRKLLKEAKGFKWGRKNKIKLAKEAVVKAGVHSFRDRRRKKRIRRAIWQIRISAFAKERGLNYSKFINLLKINKIELDRKVLSDLAVNFPLILDKIYQEYLLKNKN